ncbi:LysR family transcriptional regulator, partial [Rhizobiaceae sp. 2RAB30]
MSQKLPPLNALKAFEAAARHLSVKAAAEELFGTRGAVCQMVTTRGARRGGALFERVKR